MSNSTRTGALVALAAVALAALPFAAGAQSWPEVRAKLAAAAAQEGELVVYSQPNKAVRDFLTEQWAKAYPNVKLTLVVTPAPQFVARIRTERAADRFLWDLGFTGATTGYTLAKDNALDPVMPELVDPDVARPEVWGGWDQPFVDLAKKHVFSTSVALKTPVYNAVHVPPEKVKRLGLKVLFDPELKDRIIWHDPAIPGGGQQYAWYLRTRLGDAELKRFIVEQRVKFVRNQHEVVEALARGTAWLGLGPGNARVLTEPYLKAGVKVDIRTMGNAPELNDITIGGSTIFFIKNRPHPNAARLFVNWLFSRDVQTAFSKATEQNSRRTDVPAVSDPGETPIPGAKYVAPQREEHLEALMGAVKFVGEVRKSVQ